MLLVVTPDQKCNGYLLRVEQTILKLPYKVLWKMSDGNYVVGYSHEILDA